MGQGRLEDLIVRAMRLQADFIVVDKDLTPAQARAIAEATDLKVIDRSQLILDIFARRARTSEGKIQVELAQLKYLLPRLMSRGDSGLSRLAGGIGGRGPGEQKLEADRRRVRDRIRSLERMLGSERTRREQRRSRRRERDVPVVSLVGYTNAGKSTLLNRLTRSEVFVENKMFATLDPTSRRLRLPREREIVINDTVGFIRDLPKDLLAAFRSTLEEIQESDLVVHLVDGSHPDQAAQIAAVERILRELGYGEIPRLLVFNKADVLTDDQLAERIDGRTRSPSPPPRGKGCRRCSAGSTPLLPSRWRMPPCIDSRGNSGVAGDPAGPSPKLRYQDQRVRLHAESLSRVRRETAGRQCFGGKVMKTWSSRQGSSDCGADVPTADDALVARTPRHVSSSRSVWNSSSVGTMELVEHLESDEQIFVD
jgi:GTP-binding protein HflX